MMEPNDALLKVKHFLPDVVISDLNMPKMSGFEVVGRLLLFALSESCATITSTEGFRSHEGAPVTKSLKPTSFWNDNRLAILFGCGLRRSELVGLKFDDVQVRQGHWAIVDLVGKGGHIRTVPIPTGRNQRSMFG